MKYHNITKCDLKNGEGIRVVLWVSHCEHYCTNCHNPETWNKDSGIPFDLDAKNELFEELKKDYVSGITLSGGDPLSTLNREEILLLLKEIKDNFKDKNVWCYTGYSYEDIKNLKHLEYIDVLVDGKYIEKLSKPNPRWRGSYNQRVIDVKKTLNSEKVYVLV
ncbi:MAG: anaerobic ribonucleoside-triphosphate reductase activating protein [Peptostreptococcaceae bacterium]